MNLPRYAPEHELPPYSYVPGLFPHPISDPRGHMFGQRLSPAVLPADAEWRRATEYLAGLDLFNHGYYWEAHEAWEAVWQAVGRSGERGEFLKGLIKLAAAGVKAREGNASGIARHALRSAELFACVAESRGGDDRYGGLSLAWLIEHAEEVARDAERLVNPSSAPVVRVFAFVLELAIS
jgi:hypothetical protein